MEIVPSKLPLNKVIETDQLAFRATKPTNPALVTEVLTTLALTMAESPELVLQLLVDETRRLCNAGSAGISLLEPENACFRWQATSGALGPFAGKTMPRDFSPCGTVLDENKTLLMVEPVRHFGYIEGLPVPVREVLLVPFHQNRHPIGSLWVVAHDEDRQFDRDDAHVVTSLSLFAAAAWQILSEAKAEIGKHGNALKLAENKLALLTEQHQKITESERDKGQFLATLTHELRNSLAPMYNAVQIIKLSADLASQTKARNILEHQISQMTHLVDDLLDIARLSKMRFELTEVRLDQVVSKALEAHREQIDNSGQLLKYQAFGNDFTICGDETRLHQVLSNLLTNAVKYGVGGGVIEVTLREQDSHAILTIKDQGIGIEADMQKHIFDLFVQADQSLEKSQGGLGIGLALVKRLVEMHDGEISVSSDGLGKGSVFIVRFPLVSARPKVSSGADSVIKSSRSDPNDSRSPISDG